MSKVALITDTHWGVKGGSPEFLENLKLFLDNIFFPYLEKEGITRVIHLGDLVHERKRIGFSVLAHLRRNFLDVLERKKIRMDILIGNHDMPYKEVYNDDACNELLYSYSNIRVIDSPTEDGDFLLLPWITKNNRDQMTAAVANTKAKYAFAHLELAGFNFSKTQVATHGDDPATFKKFETVFSGHYHYRHSKGNIFYLGSPTQHTWIDVDTKRGFHVLDTETGVVEFIENPYNIYENVKYGQVDIGWSVPNKRYMRLYYSEGVKQSELDAFIADLYKAGALNVETRIIRNNQAVEIGESDEAVIENVEDTPTFIRNNIEEVDVAELLVQLYNEAISEDITT